MRATGWPLPAAVVATGAVATGAAAVAGGLPAADALALVGYAAGGSAVAGTVAVGLLGAVRRSSVVTQAIVVAFAPVLAVGIGVSGAAAAMFISGHDFHALMVVLVAAGTVGVLTGLLLGRRVAAVGRSLGVAARRLGDGFDDGFAGDLVDGTGEDAPARRGGRGARAGPSSLRDRAWAASPSAPAGDRRDEPAPPSELAALAAELEATSARLVEARERTAALEHSRRELVAWVSHDLRTPLAGIRAMVEALEDGVVDDPGTVARYHRTIRREADRLAGLVDDLFELSRIQAGALGLEFERVPLAELVSDAVAGASIAAGSKGVDLRGAVGHPSPVVELSTPEMARVIRNLVDNAIRHTPPGGTVQIEAGLDPSGTAALLTVQDACGGIPAVDLDHVFETAYRGDAARTPGDGGAGLGLAVARGLVEAQRGEISVRNHADGCRFTVRLPVPDGRATGP